MPKVVYVEEFVGPGKQAATVSDDTQKFETMQWKEYDLSFR